MARRHVCEHVRVAAYLSVYLPDRAERGRLRAQRRRRAMTGEHWKVCCGGLSAAYGCSCSCYCYLLLPLLLLLLLLCPYS